MVLFFLIAVMGLASQSPDKTSEEIVADCRSPSVLSDNMAPAAMFEPQRHIAKQDRTLCLERSGIATETASTVHGTRLAAPSSVKPNMPASGWWESFKDDTLNRLVSEALLHSPDTRIAVARLDEAKALRSQSLRMFDPQGTATLGAVRQYSSDGAIVATGNGQTGSALDAGSGLLSILFAGITPKVDLGLFGRRTANRKVADADYEAARIAFDEARRQLSVSVATALMRARVKEIGRDRSVALVKLMERRLSNNRMLVARGLRSPASSTYAVSDLSVATERLEGADSNLDAVKREILLLVGRPNSDPDSLELGTPGSAVSLPREVPPSFLRKRADVTIAHARLLGAIGRARLAKLELYPSISLIGDGSLTSVQAVAGGTIGLWSLGAGMLFPILDRGRLLAQAHGAKSRADLASGIFEQTVQRAYSGAATAMRSAASDASRAVALEAQSDADEKLLTAAREGLSKGLINKEDIFRLEEKSILSNADCKQVRAELIGDNIMAIYELGGADLR